MATPSVLSLLQGCQAPETPWTPAFFTEGQGKFVRKMVDVMLPAVGDLPSATEVNVHLFIDKFCKEVISIDDKPVFRRNLSGVINELLALSGEENIAEVDEDEYEKLLTTYLVKSKEEHKEIKQRVESSASDDLDNETRVYDFLYNFRDMSVWAYKTNEVVGESILAYTSVPGEQRGCVDLRETTGGMAWAMEW